MLVGDYPGCIGLPSEVTRPTNSTTTLSMQLSFSQKPNSSDQTETGQLQKDSLPGLPKVVAARCAKARHAQHAQLDGSKNYTNNLLCQTLTPLTLELGGKSPAFVDAGCGHREAWIRPPSTNMDLLVGDSRL